eukprot:scaffold29843_cov63-Phaeocystis_antarctica.AAC.5
MQGTSSIGVAHAMHQRANKLCSGALPTASDPEVIIADVAVVEPQSQIAIDSHPLLLSPFVTFGLADCIVEAPTKVNLPQPGQSGSEHQYHAGRRAELLLEPCRAMPGRHGETLYDYKLNSTEAVQRCRV